MLSSVHLFKLLIVTVQYPCTEIRYELTYQSIPDAVEFHGSRSSSNQTSPSAGTFLRPSYRLGNRFDKTALHLRHYAFAPIRSIARNFSDRGTECPPHPPTTHPRPCFSDSLSSFIRRSGELSLRHSQRRTNSANQLYANHRISA